MSQVSIGELIDQETERRLEIMEREDYEFPARIGKGDVIAIVASIAVSLGLIVCCMTGGIA